MNAKKYTVESISPRLNEFLRPLLKRARFELDYELTEGHSVHPEYESPEVAVQFKGPDVDLLLANKAELLLALEQVTMEALRMPSEDHSRISFDANDYRMLRICLFDVTHQHAKRVFIRLEGRLAQGTKWANALLLHVRSQH